MLNFKVERQSMFGSANVGAAKSKIEIVAMFVLGQAAHRVHTSGHMWLPTCLSICCPIGLFALFCDGWISCC